MEDNTGGCKTLLAGRNEYAGYVRKRKDQRTPAQDPPKKHAYATPRTVGGENHGRKVGGGDGRDGNDSDDERDKKGQSSRTHVGEVQEQKTLVEQEVSNYYVSGDLSGGLGARSFEELYAEDSDYGLPRSPRSFFDPIFLGRGGDALRTFATMSYDEWRNQNPYVNPWADEGEQTATPSEATQPNQLEGPPSKGKEKEIDNAVSASSSASSSILPRASTSTCASSESHISSVPEGDGTEARHARDEDLYIVESMEDMNVETVPEIITEDVDTKKATRELEKNAEKKWYKWKR